MKNKVAVLISVFGILFWSWMTYNSLIQAVIWGAWIVFISFTLWMAVDAAKQDRFWWVIFVLGAPIVGSAIYYYTEKKHEYAKIESHHIHDSETESQHEMGHDHHDKKKVASRKPRLKGRSEASAQDIEAKKEETVAQPEVSTVEIESSVSSEEKQA